MTMNEQELRKEFGEFVETMERGIKAENPRMSQLEVLAVIAAALFKITKDSGVRVLELELQVSGERGQKEIWEARAKEWSNTAAELERRNDVEPGNVVAWENPSTHAILREESPDMCDNRRKFWRPLVYGITPQWRCFHCDEVFVDEAKAREHFGTSLMQSPACTIDAAHVRELEAELARHRSEDTDLHRQIYGMQAAERGKLMREEEKGYARGLADGMKEAAKLGDTLDLLIGGLDNCIENATLREDDYDVGYMAAMKKSVIEVRALLPITPAAEEPPCNATR